MFKSKDKGLLLYNSGSNSFAQVGDSSIALINQIIQNPNMDFSNIPDVFFKLRFGGFIVDDREDDDLVRILKMRRLTSNYAGDQLLLTVALTKECNFACEYCFEQNRTSPSISDETADRIVQFIDNHKLINEVKVTWYGGEPLLEFEKLRHLSKKIQKLGIKYDAQLITNGYLLSAEVIAALNELEISSLQITIDGTRETHNKRRYLTNGNGTYDRVIGNIKKLMASDWKGILYLRVNVDKRNDDEFAKVYRQVERKYSDKFNSHVYVYPGFVNNYNGDNCSYCFNSNDEGQFLVELFRKHGINTLSTFPRLTMGGCTMTKRNAYVVGPEGELYKCWHNLGDNNEIVGSISSLSNWNTSLIAEGMVGASYLEDESCKTCMLVPICDGGCPKLRMLNNRDKVDITTCSYFKKHIKQLLEIHYEQYVMTRKD